MHNVPYCLQVPLCQFMSGPIYAYFQSMAYTSFDKDTATPKEKGSLTFPDPILDFGVILVIQKLQVAIDKCHLRKGSGQCETSKRCTCACP